MVAIAQFDPLSIFFRRIGYSVGLEFTFERVGELLSLYRDKKDISYTTWTKLVTAKRGDGGWGRQASAVSNIADFFFSLGLIQLNQSDVIVQNNLDAMAITSDILCGECATDDSFNFLLLWSILTSDGEIFVNLLLSGFDKSEMRKKLVTVVETKREALYEAASNRLSRQQIYGAINIECKEVRSPSTSLKTQREKSLSDVFLERHQRNLASAKGYDQVDISDDYFKKVPPRRRAWAESLNLWDGHGNCLTPRGQHFLDALNKLGYVNDNGCFVFWPMDYELIRSGFHPCLFSSHSNSLWGCLVDFRNAYSLQMEQGMYTLDSSLVESEHVVSMIIEMINLYRRYQVRKVMLRRELPLTVAYPVFVARSLCDSIPLVDAPKSIECEQDSRNSRISLRNSRSSSGALYQLS